MPETTRVSADKNRTPSERDLLQQRFFHTCAGFGVGVAFHPLHYAKILMQLGHEPLPMNLAKTYVFFGKEAYCLPNTFVYLRHVKETDGFSGLFRGVGASLCHNIMGLGVSLTVQKFLDDNYPDAVLSASQLKRETDREAFIRFLDKFCKQITCKMLGSVAARPFQVVMIRKMAQFIGRETIYGGIFASLSTIYHDEGVAGLFSGLAPQLVGEFLLAFVSSSLLFIVERTMLRYETATKEEEEEEEEEEETESSAQSSHKTVKKFIRFAIPYGLGILCYPFSVVSTVLAVNGSPLQVGQVTVMPIFGHWQDCYDYLAKDRQLKRGSKLFLRFYDGPTVRDSGNKVYAKTSPSWSALFLSVTVAFVGYYVVEKLLFLYSPILPDFSFLFDKLSNGGSSTVVNATTAAESTKTRSPCMLCNSPNCVLLNSVDKRTACDSNSCKNFDNFQLPRIVDEALEQFLTTAFEHHVHDWYDPLTEDRNFLYELRRHLRHVLAVLLHRLVLVDLNDVILRKVLPKAIRYLRVYIHVRNRYPDSDSADLEQKFLDYIKPSLHAAMCNREAEMTYLRTVAETLLKKSLESSPVTSWPPAITIFLRELLAFAVLSPVMDILADPDILNRLVELFFDPVAMETYENEPLSDTVPFLNRFVDSHRLTTVDSFLQVKLSEILTNQPMLYAFMNFMKSIDAPMNLLHFLMAARELQEKMHKFGKPDSKPESSVKIDSNENYAHLRWEVWELYRIYFHEAAVDKIVDEFTDSSLSNEFKSAMETSDDLNLLKQILENAYMDIYGKLQRTYIVQFHSSPEFFEFVCGDQDESLTATTNYESMHFDGGDKVDFSTEQSQSLDSVELDENDSLNNLKRRISGALKSTGHEDDVIAGAGANPPIDILVEDSSILDQILDDNDEHVFVTGADDDDVDIVDVALHGSIITDTDLAHQSDFAAGLLSSLPRDLNQWKIQMPRVEPRRDPGTGRTMYVYLVLVERTDLPPGAEELVGHRQWKIDRRYNEFYVLETKLVEFHGEMILGGFPLPPKKTFNTKSRAFVEGMRSIFEQFVKRLLASPYLKNSELLLAFLTSQEEFTLSFLSNPLKAVRSIPSKFAFERGQHLMQFLQNFVDSVDTPAAGGKSTNGQQQQLLTTTVSMSKSSSSLNSLSSELSRGGCKENGGGVNAKKKLTLENSLYKNNCNVSSMSVSQLLAKCQQSSSLDQSISTDVDGATDGFSSVYDVILFLLHNVFKVSKLVFSAFVGFRMLLKRTVDCYVDTYLRRKLCLALHERRVAELIRLLHETLFLEEEHARDVAEKSQRRQMALQSIHAYFDVELPVLKILVGQDEFERGVKLIFECLQNPRSNKQLSYTLLDMAIVELFPDYKV